jgi:hypothetical protein
MMTAVLRLPADPSNRHQELKRSRLDLGWYASRGTPEKEAAAITIGDRTAGVHVPLPKRLHDLG